MQLFCTAIIPEPFASLMFYTVSNTTSEQSDEQVRPYRWNLTGSRGDQVSLVSIHEKNKPSEASLHSVSNSCELYKIINSDPHAYTSDTYGQYY